jgi:PiT family inorganic phosphate transporter
MGIIALALVAGTSAGAFEHLPGWLQFLHTPPPPPGENIPIALWIKILCALTMASGTAAGGWRIIKTLGHKMVKLQPVNGVAAEASSALVILGATHFGLPVSTTHTISAAILGVGAAKRFTAVKWSVVEQIIWGWIFTIPASGLVGFLLQEAAQSIGIH